MGSRVYSAASSDALAELHKLLDEIKTLSDQVMARSQPPDDASLEELGRAATEIGQASGQICRLQGRVDEFLLSGLMSGLDEAKALRRNLTSRCAQLSDRFAAVPFVRSATSCSTPPRRNEHSRMQLRDCPRERVQTHQRAAPGRRRGRCKRRRGGSNCRSEDCPSSSICFT
jgi:hypothetical protein